MDESNSARYEPTAEDEQAFVDEVLRNPNADYHVVEVTPLHDYCFDVRFRDGLCGRVYMKEQIFSPDAGVFASLRDPLVFSQMHIDHGATVWANGLDVAPDAMYFAFKRYGKWVLR